MKTNRDDKVAAAVIAIRQGVYGALSDYENDGIKATTKAIRRGVFWALLYFTAVVYVGVLAINYSPIGKDSTDGVGRSGLEVRADNETGCQYLVTPSGAITPRMKQGRHLGCEG